METQGLLTRGHAVGLVEDDDLVTSRRQCHFVLREHFDFATDNINATLVRRIELEHAILDRIAQHFAGEGHDTRCLADTRRACEDHVRHVAILGNGSQTLHRVLVSNHIVQLQWPVFFHPGSERASPWKKRGEVRMQHRSNGLDMARITGTSYQLSPVCEFHDLRCAQWCAGGLQFHTRERRATPSKLTAKDVEMQVASMHATPHC